MPADHVIADADAFGDAVERAFAAAGGRLVTFGITPTGPHTGYGYIRKGDPLPELPGCFDLDRFVEKPDAATAQAWVDSGAYLWNSGIFLLPAARYLEEIERRQPAIVAACGRACRGERRSL